MTSRRALRVLATGAVSASLVPTVLVLVALRAEAAPTVFGTYSATSVVRASGTSGDIGATGGLTPLDSGSASIDASLDNSPTAMVLARPVEPGTSFATVNSQLPTPATVPSAQAAYPGRTLTASTAPAPTTTATAKVTRTSADGTAQTAGGSAGVASVGAVTASTHLAATGDGHQVTLVGDAYASGFDAAGVLTISGVRGQAQISATAGGKRNATASTTIGSITVAGQAVTVDDSGLHAVGTTLPLGPTLAQLTATANNLLKAAGISVAVAAPIHTVTTTSLGSHAFADSGGLLVTISTPVIGSSTVPPNTATVILGRVQLSESDSPGDQAGPPVVVTTPEPTTSPAAGQPGTPGTPGEPGQVITVGGGGTGGTTTGVTVPPTVAQGSNLVLAGHRVSAQAAIAGLGGWMALTLGAATYATLALRRPEEEEHLCPCP